MLKGPNPSPKEADTFIVNVHFRQNATWQGTVKWLGHDRELNFRSALELLKIMDGVLEENHPQPEAGEEKKELKADTG